MSDLNLRKSTLHPLTTSLPLQPQAPQPETDKPIPSEPPNRPLPPLPTDQVGASRQLTSEDTVEKIKQETLQAPLEELQSKAQELSQVKLSAPLNTLIAQTIPVQGPRMITSEAFQDQLTSTFSTLKSLSSLEQHTQDMVQASSKMTNGQSQVTLIESSLQDNLKRLTKREERYNAPLYRLGDKMGIKNRALKLQALHQQRDQLIQHSNQLLALHQARFSREEKELGKAGNGLQDAINQAYVDGHQLVKTNLNQPGMLWKLSMQSGPQLKETLSTKLIETLPHHEELLSTYRTQEKAYTERVEALSELRAHAINYNKKKAAFSKSLNQLENPKEKESLLQRFHAEEKAFLLSLKPLADKVNAPEKIMGKEDKQLNLALVQQLERLPDAPPSLYQLLPAEKKAYIDKMAQGIHESLPNRLLVPDSLTLNGTVYSHRTKIAQAGFAEIFTYENDKGEKVVVKQPIKREEMTEEDFANTVLKESVNELETYHQTLGDTGQGHPNVLKLMGAIHTEQGPLIALEYINGGNCSELIVESLPQRITSGDLTQDEAKTVQKYVLFQ